MKQLEPENARLKEMVADLSLVKEMLQDVIQKKAPKPAGHRELAHPMVDAYRCSKRRATSLVGLSRLCFYYKAHRRDDLAESQRIQKIAEDRVCYGMWRIRTLMRREAWLINHKKTHRIYCEEGLNLRRRRPRRRVAAAHRMERPELSTINECWSMDFVVDNLFNGNRIRALTVVDNFSRECLAITVDRNLH